MCIGDRDEQKSETSAMTGYTVACCMMQISALSCCTHAMYVLLMLVAHSCATHASVAAISLHHMQL